MDSAEKSSYNGHKSGVAGQKVLVTGGTTGIGLATASLLARQGAHVLIAGRDPSHMNDALSSIRGEDITGTIDGIITDLSSKEGISNLFQEVDRRFDKLDILINNAALPFQSIMEGSYEDWELVTKTNLLSYMACTWHAIDRMRQHRSGHIVNIGSMSADVREKNSSVYVATKSGIQGFSGSLRKEVNELGIKITLIEPGAVVSDLHDIDAEEQNKKQEKHEMLKAEDVAAAVFYTLSQARWCDVVEIKIKPLLQIV